jgi:hypothetical protein
MRVQELVERYNKNNRIDIAKEIEAQKYVGIEAKRHLASLVLDNCITVVDGEVHIDSVERYLLFTMAVISMHTNLEFSSEDDEEYGAIDAYDALCEAGLLVKVIDTFKDDYASCQEVLNMMTTDRLQDNMTIEKKLGKFLDDIQDLLGGAVSGLVDKLNIEDFMENLPVDAEKIISLLNVNKE